MFLLTYEIDNIVLTNNLFNSITKVKQLIHSILSFTLYYHNIVRTDIVFVI